MADRVERLTNLLALLLETSEPLSLVEIAAELDGQYPATDVARRQAFERDKQALRELGVPIDTEILAGGPYAGQTRYRIDRDKYELADLDLEPDEMHALQVAVAAVRTGSGTRSFGDLEARRSARRRATTGVGPRARPSRAAGDPGGGGVAFDDRRSCTGAPSGTSIRGVCSCAAASGTSSVSTTTAPSSARSASTASTAGASSIVVGPPGSFERPADFDPRSAFPADPKQIGQSPDEAIEATVRIDAGRAAAAVRELGDDRVRAPPRRRFDRRCACPPTTSTRSAPGCSGCSSTPSSSNRPSCGPSIVTWLTDVADGRSRDRAMSPTRLRTAEERLQRLLVMLPWLMEVGEAPLAEVARRFDMTEADVEKNLELVAMCGLPPFVDEMIDVFVDEGIVYVGVPRLFTRPLRLTVAGGVRAARASARAAMELPGADRAGPLGRGLGKLDARPRRGRPRRPVT